MTYQPGLPPPHQPPPVAYPAPARVEPMPGTPFGLAIPATTPIASGMATGSLVAGIASILVSFAVICLGLAGADRGWGGWAAGAFAVLAGLLGVGGVVLGVLGRRQVSRAAAVTGRGLATAGVICAAVGLLLAMVGLAAAVLLTLSLPTS